LLFPYNPARLLKHQADCIQYRFRRVKESIAILLCQDIPPSRAALFS